MDFVPNDGLHKYSLQTHMHKYMYMCVIVDSTSLQIKLAFIIIRQIVPYM